MGPREWETGTEPDGLRRAHRKVLEHINPEQSTSNQLPLIANVSRSYRGTLHGIIFALTNYPKNQEKEKGEPALDEHRGDE